MNKVILEFETEDFSEINEAVASWVEQVILEAPPQIQSRPQSCYLAIPNVIQRMILRHFRRQQQQTFIGSFASDDHNTVFKSLYGYPVIPGYEMAIVLFLGDGAIDPERAVYRIPISNAPWAKNVPDEIQK